MGRTNISYWEKLIALNRPSYNSFFEQERKYLQSAVSYDSRLLDVCCGTGRTLEACLAITPNLTGLDHDLEAIEAAKKRLTQSPFVSLVCADALKMPFADNSFDYATCLLSIVNFDNKKVDLLKEMARISQKVIVSAYNEHAFNERLLAYRGTKAVILNIDSNGKFCFSMDSGIVISEQFSSFELQRLAKQAGLNVDKIKKEGIGYLCTFSKK